MDYIGNKCPACQKYFHADDDIVVCPECGTPQHRECYEQNGHCCNEHLHAQGYDYQKEHEHSAESTNVKRCPNCGKENDPGQFFCVHCGTSLSPTGSQNGNPQQPNFPQGMPYGAGQNQNGGNAYNIPFMDPLGGVPGDTDFGDGVTAGETAKYVKQNTPYFIRVFSNIKNFNRSKFNFAAAIFTGGYLLYRKMYKLGAIFASIQLLLLIVESYITIAYSSLFTDFVSVYANSGNMADLVNGFYQYMGGLSAAQILMLYLPTLIDIIRIVLMVVMGVCTNRMYMKHCIRQINLIKQNAAVGENPEATLQTKGGVNTALAVSLLVAYLVILYLPNFITGFM